jgi:hypothetical protein
VGGTPVTDNNTPTFSGVATPGYVVAIMAQADGADAPVQVGQTTAAADGTWSSVTNTLSDGGYTFYVRAFSADNPFFSAQTTPMGRVVIETSGPRVANIVYNAKQGTFNVTYADAVGLNMGSLLNPAAYTLSQGKKTLHGTVVTPVSGNGTTSETVSVVVTGAKKLKTGKQLLTISGGVVQNAAGEKLDGSFRGTLPSGSGSPGTSFLANFNVTSTRKAKGPLPVAVTVASVTPQNTAARVFAAGVSTRSVKAIHADYLSKAVELAKSHSKKH